MIGLLRRRIPVIHDYTTPTLRWGHSYAPLKASRTSGRIVIFGGPFAKGDRLLFSTTSGGQATFTVAEVEACGDPWDLYFLQVERVVSTAAGEAS
jgi:hypothetical protein